MVFIPTAHLIKRNFEETLGRIFKVLLKGYILLNSEEFTRFTKAIDEFESGIVDNDADLQ